MADIEDHVGNARKYAVYQRYGNGMSTLWGVANATNELLGEMEWIGASPRPRLQSFWNRLRGIVDFSFE